MFGPSLLIWWGWIAHNMLEKVFLWRAVLCYVNRWKINNVHIVNNDSYNMGVAYWVCWYRVAIYSCWCLLDLESSPNERFAASSACVKARTHGNIQKSPRGGWTSDFSPNLSLRNTRTAPLENFFLTVVELQNDALNHEHRCWGTAVMPRETGAALWPPRRSWMSPGYKPHTWRQKRVVLSPRLYYGVK